MNPQKEERKRCDEIVEKIENFRLKSAEYKSQEKTKRQEHNKLSAMILNTQKEVKNVERASQAYIYYLKQKYFYKTIFLA